MNKEVMVRRNLKNIGIIFSSLDNFNETTYQLAIKLEKLPNVNKIFLIIHNKGYFESSKKFKNNIIKNYFSEILFHIELFLFSNLLKNKEVKSFSKVEISKINNDHIIPIFNVSKKDILDNKFNIYHNGIYKNISLDIAIDLEQMINFSSIGKNISFLLLSLKNPESNISHKEECLMGVIRKSDFTIFEIYIMGLDIRDPKLISLGKTNTRRFWVTNLAYSMEALIQELVRILQNYSENDNFIKSIYELTDCKKVYQKNLIDLKHFFLLHR